MHKIIIKLKVLVALLSHATDYHIRTRRKMELVKQQSMYGDGVSSGNAELFTDNTKKFEDGTGHGMQSTYHQLLIRLNFNNLEERNSVTVHLLVCAY
jgi:hypothetical protein